MKERFQFPEYIFDQGIGPDNAKVYHAICRIPELDLETKGSYYFLFLSQFKFFLLLYLPCYKWSKKGFIKFRGGTAFNM